MTALYASVSGGGPPLVLLHGLFGMGSNLGAVARALAEHFEVHQVDLPNHGRSPWMAPVSLSAMAASVYGYVREHCAGRARLLGHSLGAKVAMQLALSHPRAVTALVAADMAPVAYPPRIKRYLPRFARWPWPRPRREIGRRPSYANIWRTKPCCAFCC